MKQSMSQLWSLVHLPGKFNRSFATLFFFIFICSSVVNIFALEIIIFIHILHNISALRVFLVCTGQSSEDCIVREKKCTLIGVLYKQQTVPYS